MTRIEKILKEINQLNSSELEIVLKEIHRKVDKEKIITSILKEYKGIGKGIWKIDAQQYIDQERDQDRA